MTEQQLIDDILSARDSAAYARIDVYLKKHPKQITIRVAQALEAYEMYRPYVA